MKGNLTSRPRVAAHALVAAILLLPPGARAANPNQLTDAEKKEGWKLLFDGRTTRGWRGYKMAAMPAKGWKVEDGILKKIGGEQGGDIITEEKFDDFDLAWEWRISPGGNNGIKYLVTEDRPSAPGHEYQMIDDTRNSDARVGPHRATGSFYDVLPPAADKPLRPAGEWNQSRVLIQGNHVEHWLNGKKVLEYELGSDAVKAAVAKSKFKNAPGFGEKIKGHILLTDHHDECGFRSIKIRELRPPRSVRVLDEGRDCGTFNVANPVSVLEILTASNALKDGLPARVILIRANGKTVDLRLKNSRMAALKMVPVDTSVLCLPFDFRRYR